ncbi:hypothetical protein CEXT_507171 [Caerostris extrusa]|uniref:Uncharacterized protein n=1 Tax=Caerostris extrusa TaxID=172846 RepID=A0AAV4URW2_CAEEX|nr:hypothetical protein CEXT_507171 [Caerostris extrusa]
MALPEDWACYYLPPSSDLIYNSEWGAAGIGKGNGRSFVNQKGVAIEASCQEDTDGDFLPENRVRKKIAFNSTRMVSSEDWACLFRLSAPIRRFNIQLEMVTAGFGKANGRVFVNQKGVAIAASCQEDTAGDFFCVGGGKS